MSSEAALTIVPLGGCGEVGLNATLLIEGDEALLIDCGILLGVEGAPGVERAVPGFEALFSGKRKLAGVVLTHGHEDHIGALPALLGEIDAPVFGAPLTIALARARLEGLRGRSPVPEEAKRQARDRLTAIPIGGRASLGPFSVELIRVTHSLPDSAALHIETRSGRVLHSGDFKLDRHPHDGRLTDVERLRAIGEQGLDLLLSDSTNAEVPGRSGEETEVGLAIDRLIAEAQGRVIVGCLASHLHRIEAIARAARRNGRRLALVGRALHEMWRIGIEQGQLHVDEGLLVVEERLPQIPSKELVVITTGTQGEPQAGLARFASGKDALLRPEKSDRVILSARTIPGNERPVRRVMNQLARLGLEVITDRMAAVHCSGHACQSEQDELLRLLKPRCFVPVHGERAMLEAHAKTAEAAGVSRERMLIIEDGESVVLTSGTISRGPEEPVSRRALDAEGRALDWGDVRDRQRIGRSGLCVCSIAIDQRTGRLIGEPAISFRGLTMAPGLIERVRSFTKNALEERLLEDTAAIERSARSAIKGALKDELRTAPEIELQVLRVETRDGVK
jgi:ribonuclease J